MLENGWTFEKNFPGGSKKFFSSEMPMIWVIFLYVQSEGSDRYMKNVAFGFFQVLLRPVFDEEFVIKGKQKQKKIF